MSGALLVLTTVGNSEDAERLAQALLERRLAACVNIVPGVVSIYRWKDGISRDDERLLIIKTTSDRIAELEHVLVSIHPYELPEVVTLAMHDVHGAYLQWMKASVAREG